MLGYTPQADIPFPQADIPLGRHLPRQAHPLGRHPPPRDTLEYGQQVGGTHPTGMHTSLKIRNKSLFTHNEIQPDFLLKNIGLLFYQ